MGDGASECASGSHVCTGTRPIFVPYPRTASTNVSRITDAGKRCAPAIIFT